VLVRNEVLFALFGMFAVGLADLFRRRGLISGGSPVTYMAMESSFIAAFSIAALLVLEGRLHLRRDVLLFSPASGFFIFIGILGLLFALTTGQASRFVPITRMGFVVTFLLATILFGESVTPSKLAGVVLAAAAVILLSVDL